MGKAVNEITIYQRNGSVRYVLNNKTQLCAIKSAEQKCELLGEDSVTLKVTSAAPLECSIGDYIVVYGKAYTLNSAAECIKSGEREFETSFTFEGLQYKLLDVQYRNADAGGNNPTASFSIVANLQLLMEVLITNINRVAGSLGESWQLGECPADTEYKEFTYSNQNCLAVLQSACEEYKMEFDIEDKGGKQYVLNIRKQGSVFPITFDYSKQSGVVKLQRKNVNSGGIVTRLYVEGSTQNISKSYKNGSERLRISDNTESYVQDALAVAAFGIKEGSKQYDDIFPHRTGKVTGIVAGNVLQFVDADMFDLNAKDASGNTLWLIDGTAAKVKFTGTSNLAGYEFELHKYDHKTHTFTLIKYEDKRGLQLPDGGSYKIEVGDEYVLLDIVMPQDPYVTDAEAELKAKGLEDIAELCQPKVEYEVDIASLSLEKSQGSSEAIVNVFRCGDYLHIKDADINVDKSIRIKSFTRDAYSDPYKYKLTLSDTMDVSIAQKLIEDTMRHEEIITLNQLTSAAKARANWRTTQELLNMVFDSDGYFDAANIKPNSIETMMLSVGNRAGQFILRDLVITANGIVAGKPNPNLLVISSTAKDAQLIHYAIEEHERVWSWDKSMTTFTLTSNGAYYIYAQCAKNVGVFRIIATQDKLPTEVANQYYYFQIGILSSVFNGYRELTITYGSTRITGRCINCGRIESIDKSTYFDLDNGEIGGNIKFVSTDGSLKPVGELESGLAGANDAIDGLTTQVGEQSTNISNLYDTTELLKGGISEHGTSIEEMQALINGQGLLLDELQEITDSLKSQVDGTIEYWYGIAPPTMINEPARNWNTEELLREHVGDLYTDTSTGLEYRFGVTYDINKRLTGEWQEVASSGVGTAIQAANTALATANSKNHVYVTANGTTPPAPTYHIGDLWLMLDTCKMRYCIRDCNNAYQSSDWINAGYTDDTAANAAQAELNALADDSKITPAEKIQLNTQWQYLMADYAAVVANATAAGVPYTELTSAYNTLNMMMHNLLADMSATSNVNRTAYNTAFTTYYSKRAEVEGNIARSKSKVHVTANSNIVPPITYQRGDMWLTLNDYKIKLCISSCNGAFAATDWAAAGYTDDTAANAAQEQLNALADDSKITPAEKLTLATEMGNISADFAATSAKATALSVETTAYETAYTALNTYVAGLLADMNSTSTINRATYNSKFADYYTQRAAIIGAMSQKLNGSVQELYDTTALLQEGFSEHGTTISEMQGYINGQSESIKALQEITENLKSQIDGTIEYWYGAEQPSTSNYPASGWNTEEMRKEHLGDIYTDTATGLEYRYSSRKNGAATEYYWQEIASSGVGTAIQAANEALNTANGKNHTFVTANMQQTPAATYKVGDLWITLDNLKMRYCIADGDGVNYKAADWKDAGYTDDTAANAAQAALDAMAADNVITPAEKLQLQSEWQRLAADYAVLIAQATAAKLNTNALLQSFNNLRNMVTTLLEKMDKPSNIDRAVYNGMFNTYYQQRANTQTALTNSMSRVYTTANANTPPAATYRKGDLWLMLDTYKIKVCITTCTGSYKAADWKEAGYTDDTAANAAQAELNALASDSVITPSEKLTLETQMSNIAADFAATSAKATTLHVETTAFEQAYNALKTYTDVLLEDVGVSSSVVRTEYNTKFSAYYTERANLLTGISITLAGQITGLENTTTLLQEGISEHGTTIEEMEAYINGQSEMLQELERVTSELKAQIDGAIEYWFGTEIPTEDNYPASEWEFEARYEHIGDVYTNTATGLEYRYAFVADAGMRNPRFYWQEIASSGIGQAIQQANNAMQVANGKSHVYVTASVQVTPAPTYQKGDLWITLDTRKMRYCVNDGNGVSYLATDWREAGYTDDTTANAAMGQLADMANDGIVTPVEKLQMQALWKELAADYAVVITQADAAGVAHSTLTLYYGYLETMFTSILEDMSTNSTITRSTYNRRIEYYYKYRAQCLKNISDKKCSVYVTANANTYPPTTYRKGDIWFMLDTYKVKLCKTSCTNSTFKASDWADAGYTDDTAANAAQSQLDALADDSKLTASEKLTLQTELSNINADFVATSGKATAVGVSTAAFEQAYTALKNYADALLEDMEATSSIDRTEYNGKFAAYYTERSNIMLAVSQKYVEDLEIGQGNYIANGAYFAATTGWNWVADSQQLYADSVMGSVLRFGKSNTTNYFFLHTGFANKGGNLMMPDNKFMAGRKYTLAFWVKANKAMQIKVGVMEPAGYEPVAPYVDVNIGTSWQRVCYTFTATDKSKEDTRLYIRSEQSITFSYLLLTKFVLVEGTKAPEWTDCSREYKAQLEANQQTLKAITDNYTQIDGGLILSTFLKLGALLSSGIYQESAGVKAMLNSKDEVAAYFGGTLAEAIAGKAGMTTIYHNGKLKAQNAEVSGKVTATEGSIGGFNIGANSINGGSGCNLQIGDTNFNSKYGTTNETKRVKVQANDTYPVLMDYNFTYKENNRVRLQCTNPSGYNWLNIGIANVMDIDYFANTSSKVRDEYGYQFAMMGKGHICMDAIVEGGGCSIINGFTAAWQVEMIKIPLESNRILIASNYDNCCVVLPDIYSILATFGYGILHNNFKKFTFEITLCNVGIKTMYIAGQNDDAVNGRFYYQGSEMPVLFENGGAMKRSLRGVAIQVNQCKKIMLCYEPKAYGYRALVVV